MKLYEYVNQFYNIPLRIDNPVLRAVVWLHAYGVPATDCVFKEVEVYEDLSGVEEAVKKRRGLCPFIVRAWLSTSLEPMDKRFLCPVHMVPIQWIRRRPVCPFGHEVDRSREKLLVRGIYQGVLADGSGRVLPVEYIGEQPILYALVEAFVIPSETVDGTVFRVVHVRVLEMPGAQVAQAPAPETAPPQPSPPAPVPGQQAQPVISTQSGGGGGGDDKEQCIRSRLGDGAHVKKIADECGASIDDVVSVAEEEGYVVERGRLRSL